MKAATTLDHTGPTGAPPPALNPLVGHTTTQFNELMKLVEALGLAEYTAPVPVLNGSSIAQHVRHVIEFYVCLMAAEDGVVNYDARKRDKTLETDRNAVLATLEALRDWLNDAVPNTALELIEDHSLDGTAPVRMHTSLYRELAYALDHGIHHMALIRIAVEQHHAHLALDPDFGVAPSTIRDRRKRPA